MAGQRRHIPSWKRRSRAERTYAKVAPPRNASKKQRRNPGSSTAPVDIPRSRAEQLARTPRVKELIDVYTNAHWGSRPTRLIHVPDKSIPPVVAMGRLEQLQGTKFGNIDFPKGCWLAWDPKHPRDRIYLVLSAPMRERLRKLMKQVDPGQMEYLQDIALKAGGDQCDRKLPHRRGIDLGPCKAVCYHTNKQTDGWSGYFHEFGHEGRRGIVPHLAIDASGACVLCGGSYRVVEAGIVG